MVQNRGILVCPSSANVWSLVALFVAVPCLFGQTTLRVPLGNAPPTEYRGPNGEARGFAVAVLEEAARREHVRIAWQSGTQFANDDELRAGRLDLIVRGYATPERLRDFYVSEPWWWSDLLGVAPVGGKVRQESDIPGSRLSMSVAVGHQILGQYPTVTFRSPSSTKEMVELACDGTTDAAVVETIFLRELLLTASARCRDVNLRTFDIKADREYRFVARRGVTSTAVALRARIDDMALDGTLAKLALKDVPFSTLQAERIADLLRERSRRARLRIWIIIGTALGSISIGFLIWLNRSRNKLRAVNEQLTETQRVSDARWAELLRTAEALRTSEQQLTTIMDTVPVGIIVIGANGLVHFANTRAADVLFTTKAELIGHIANRRGLTVQDPSGGPLPLEARPFAIVVRTCAPLANFRILITGPDGISRHISINAAPLLSEGGGVEAIVETLEDVTEKVRFDDLSLHAEKMESLGRMAGGISHDFNNLLTVILGYCQLALDQVDPPSPLHAALDSIRTAGNKAAALTLQMLAFSRRQIVLPKVLDLNEVILETELMLHSMIGEAIQLDLDLSVAPVRIVGDVGQLQRILINLASNAKDAMPEGGSLKIRTATVDTVPPESDDLPPVSPEGYVHLTVADTGVGMDERVRKHLFEPFFTTKGIGRGTGLGLSTVYGIVRQHKGTIIVDSTPDEGARVSIYWPCARERVKGPVPALQ